MITFEAGIHTYKENGLVIPSVTQILKAAGQIDDRFYQKSGTDRGSDVHDATAAIDNGDLDVEDFSQESFFPYLEAYRNFKRDTGVKIEEVELLVSNPRLHYAGTLDRIGIINGKYFLFDIKTGKGKSFWHGLQLAAYEACCNPMEKRILFLGDNGKYSFEDGWKHIKFSDPMWRSYWGAIATKHYFDRTYL